MVQDENLQCTITSSGSCFTNSLAAYCQSCWLFEMERNNKKSGTKENIRSGIKCKMLFRVSVPQTLTAPQLLTKKVPHFAMLARSQGSRWGGKPWWLPFHEHYILTQSIQQGIVKIPLSENRANRTPSDADSSVRTSAASSPPMGAAVSMGLCLLLLRPAHGAGRGERGAAGAGRAGSRGAGWGEQGAGWENGEDWIGTKKRAGSSGNEKIGRLCSSFGTQRSE
jgi:hypothetical protein